MVDRRSNYNPSLRLFLSGLAAVVLIVIGILILAGTAFGGVHTKTEVGIGFIAAGAAVFALAF